jgi:phthiocerol/phenolphthiocerol synthesis type-I polyketide synthase E
MSHADDQYNGSEIAIIGLSCRFPGAKTPEEFWKNLRDGVESISFLNDEELEPSNLDPGDFNDPNYVKAASVLDDLESFDAMFFGFSPREAEVMDPQHRLFLECAWEALEDAGYDSKSYPGVIGVYAGARTNTYLFNLFSNREAFGSLGSFEVGLGNDLGFLPMQVSYKLDLRGPSYAVHTACSTSLVAAHLACQSLLTNECDMALAGGVAVNVPHRTGYLYQPGGILSPDGHCRAFDAQAHGTIFGSGVGVVVLKRLADALSDGDTIHAVIKGSATNNDGALKASFTAPNGRQQSEVIMEAIANAGINPETISYIEAHGTGTALGDPIEIRALTRAFRAGSNKNNFCAVGSVKSNFGHLDAAAGAAGLIKTVLALKHKQLPASLHFEQPNPQIDFANSPFYVNSRLQEWRSNGSPLRAGVSSFGVGGTNAHVILEEAPEMEPGGASREYQLIVVSARSASALETASRNLAGHLSEHAEQDLADVAHTLQVGRKRMSHRRIVVCRDAPEAARLLESNEPQRVLTIHEKAENRPIVFMFPGQGSQYVNMGRGLYEGEGEFRKQVDRCATVLRERLGRDLSQLLYPPPGKEQEADAELNETRITQPALFVVEYAMAKQLEKWGVRPDAMIGHSLGEYVAACLSGVMGIEDALRLVSKRGELMQEARGGMAAVMMGEAEARERINGNGLSIAAVNGRRQVVISGPEAAIENLIEELRKEGIVNKRLKTKHAFHSQLMEGVAARYVEEVRKVELKEGEIEYISNVSGKMARAEEMTDPKYWGLQLRECVRFGDGIEELAKRPGLILLEVGPGASLSGLARLGAARAADRTTISTMRNPAETHNDAEYLTTAIGKLWMAGAEIDWASYYEGEKRRRVSLPTYPFERQRYWIEARREEEAGGRKGGRGKAIGKRSDVSEWFYAPGWRRRELGRNGAPVAAEGEKQSKYIVLEDGGSLSRKLVDRLKEESAAVISVRAGERYRRVSESGYEIRAGEKRDYEELLKEVMGDRADEAPEVVHLWSVGEERELQDATRPRERFEREQRRGFYSLLYLVQAFAKLNVSIPLKISVICDRLQQVGEEEISPEKSTILAFCKVTPQENPNISCHSIDVVPPAPGSRDEVRLVDRLITEIKEDSPEVAIAYRGNRRWVQSFEPLSLEKGAQPVRPLRVNGVYLITGGLGGVGLLIAEYLAQSVQARLVLAGRSFFPERDEWGQWLASRPEDDQISLKIRRLQAMEAAGAEVMVASADVADEDGMRALVTGVLQRYGALHGVMHAAGVTTGSSVFIPAVEIGVAEVESQFQSKAYGVYVLDRVLRNTEIDFCLLFSSNASVLGGLGLVAYSAANTFMDAFVASRDGANEPPHEFPWISATWDPWPEEMKKYAGYQTTMDQYAMTVEESIEAFDRVVTLAPEGQVVVSTGELGARLGLWVNRDATRGGARATAEALIHPRPEIESVYVAPRDNTEQTIADIWQEILGLDRVGVDDDFFVLGGHSLLAIELVGRLRNAFQVELPVGSFFQSPTVAGLAQIISDFQTGHPDPKKDELLKLLSQFSNDGAESESERQTAGF